MNKITYNKLIRDKIPEIIRERGAECETEVLDDVRFADELMRKVVEESSGLLQSRSREEMLEELGDVTIVLTEIRKLHNISDEEMEKALVDNIALKGGFDKHIYLHWSSDDGYRSNEQTTTK